MSIQTVTIKSIARNEKTSKAGKKYTSLGFKCAEHGDKWVNGFGNKSNADWKEGDEVKVDIKEVVSGDKTYLNFDMVNVESILIERVATLEAVVKSQAETINKIRETLKPMYFDWKRGTDGVVASEAPEYTPADIDNAFAEANKDGGPF